jgi:phage FluMu protein Com
MITCAECDKVLDKVPSWYSTVNIRFVCDACRKVNPQHWLPPTLDEGEEEKPLGDEDAFMRARWKASKSWRSVTASDWSATTTSLRT